MREHNNITFKEYYDFIYLNSNVNKVQAMEVANECWNKELTKYEALEIARANY